MISPRISQRRCIGCELTGSVSRSDHFHHQRNVTSSNPSKTATPNPAHQSPTCTYSATSNSRPRFSVFAASPCHGASAVSRKAAIPTNPTASPSSMR